MTFLCARERAERERERDAVTKKWGLRLLRDSSSEWIAKGPTCRRIGRSLLLSLFSSLSLSSLQEKKKSRKENVQNESDTKKIFLRPRIPLSQRGLSLPSISWLWLSSILCSETSLSTYMEGRGPRFMAAAAACVLLILRSFSCFFGVSFQSDLKGSTEVGPKNNCDCNDVI